MVCHRIGVADEKVKLLPFTPLSNDQQMNPYKNHTKYYNIRVGMVEV